MSSKCQSCGVVGLTVNDVDVAREIVGEGWETMCVECAKAYAKESKKFNQTSTNAKQLYEIGGYQVEMTSDQAKRWNTANITKEDKKTILVFIPKPQNHYQALFLGELDKETVSFMEDFEARLETDISTEAK